MSDFSYVGRNYLALKKELHTLCEKLGRPPVTLVCVTKSATDDEVRALAVAGGCDIGENRPQMLKARADMLFEAGYSPRLHEIGNLQKNKIKMIVENVSLIHSVDSLALAEEISRHSERVGRITPVLIEVNSGKEENKGGVLPEECCELFLKVRELKGIEVAGLMTMGPVCCEPEDIRPYFKLTRELFDEIREKYGFSGEGILSMGMSDSYRIAVEEGSTLVRVGRRLFEK